MRNNNARRPLILIVDDEQAHIDLITIAFKKSGFKSVIKTVSKLSQARDFCEKEEPDLILTDLILPDGKGIDLLPEERYNIKWPVIVMTSYGNEQLAVEVMRAGAVDYVVKSAHVFSAMPRIVERSLREWDYIKSHRNIEKIICVQRDLAVSLSAEFKSEQMYETIIDAVMQIDSVDGAAIYLLKNNLDTMCCVCAKTSDNTVIRNLTLVTDQKCYKKVVYERMPCYFSTWELPEEQREKTLISGIKKVALFPLRHREHVLGAIEVISKSSNSFPENIKNGLEVIANEVGGALHRADVENALANEKKQLAVTLKSIGEGVITTDVSGRIVMMNETAEQFTEWSASDAYGKKYDDIFKICTEDSRDPIENPLAEVIETQMNYAKENNVMLYSRNCKEKVISFNISPMKNKEELIGAVIVFRDTATKARLEKEMQRAHKLESIGVLAGGIAHDFNNILTGIMGNISLVKEKLTESHEEFAVLDQAENAAVRAQGLTHQLLTFAKGGKPVKEFAYIEKIVEDAVYFAIHGSNVLCRVKHAPKIYPVEIDKGQISQVIQNIVINANQAMEYGGRLDVSIKNAIVDSSSNLPLSSGKYIKITIKDDGPGIYSEHINRIFDPYFTTKAEGNGLGLAVAYSVISKHKGHISVESSEQEGTTFFIYIPASSKKGITSERTKENIVFGEGRILIMDDDDIIRESAGNMLSHLGYDVCYAETGEKAIEMYRDMMHSKPYDLLLMDLTVPGGMGGKEAIERLKKIDPSVRALVSSGYSQDPVMSNYKDYGFKGVITKPYRIGLLSEAVKKVLSR